MAKDEFRNGQAEYGIRHLNEEQMREKGIGVFAKKNLGRAPVNKALSGAPADKSLSSMTKAELIATAEAEGVDVSDASNNDERIAAIEKARKG